MSKLDLDKHSILDMNCTWDALIKAELEDWKGKLFITSSNSETIGCLRIYCTYKAEPTPEYITKTSSIKKGRIIAYN